MQRLVVATISSILAIMGNVIGSQLKVDVVWSSLWPDWILIILIFWAMRFNHLFYILVCFGFGLVQATLLDQPFGFYSSSYAAVAFLIQQARLRLIVVSQAAHFGFVALVVVCYHTLLQLALRADLNELQWPLVATCAGALLGWLFVSSILSSSQPLSPNKDLFS